MLPKSSNSSRLHKADPSRQLLEDKPGKPHHFSHPPLGGVFILVDENRKLHISKIGCQTQARNISVWGDLLGVSVTVQVSHGEGD